jgi:large subunit ribosomal protein L35
MAGLVSGHMWPGYDPANRLRRPQMPKMKTKSSAKKRFKFTANGKIKHGQAGKRHGMIKRSNEQIRELRGTSTMSASETQRVKRWMPYSF